MLIKGRKGVGPMTDEYRCVVVIIPGRRKVHADKDEATRIDHHAG